MDYNFSPWPEKYFWFTWRKVRWVYGAEPWYGDYTLRDLQVAPRFKDWPLPFLSVVTKWFHFYVGWKPITLQDPKFYWRSLLHWKPAHNSTMTYAQLSIRWGKGKIS